MVSLKGRTDRDRGRKYPGSRKASGRTVIWEDPDDRYEKRKIAGMRRVYGDADATNGGVSGVGNP